jgi:hypothetical protein
MRGDREPPATTDEGQPEERREKGEERRREAVKETRMVMERKARRGKRAYGRVALRKRATARRHEADAGHVKKVGRERRMEKRCVELALQAWEDQACENA